MELIKLSNNTYYIKNHTNIGVYKVNDTDVYLIDSGNDKDAGRKILKLLNEEGLNVVGIINTHSNADHIGGNKFIQDRTNCKIYSYGIESAFIKYPILEPSFLYGGYPFKSLRNKFLMAKESEVTDINNNLPLGLSYFSVKGHYFDMIGIKTIDNVYFLGDSLFSEDTINKYHLFYIYDVSSFLNTLDYLETLEGNYFIPSHTDCLTDISKLININRNKVYEVINLITDICTTSSTFEEILKKVFDHYNLVLDANQYVLVGNAIRSYLSYLYDNDKLVYEFVDNKMLWKKI